MNRGRILDFVIIGLGGGVVAGVLGKVVGDTAYAIDRTLSTSAHDTQARLKQQSLVKGNKDQCETKVQPRMDVSSE